MAPRGTNRVRIVSPNTGSVCYSRSVSLQHYESDDSRVFHQSHHHDPRHQHSNHNSSSHQRSLSTGSSILKKHSSFGRGERTRTPLAALPHNQSSLADKYASKSYSRSQSAPARTAAAIEAAYGNRHDYSARYGDIDKDDMDDDERALERAQEALNAAASHVLRRPFGQQKATALPPSSGATAKKSASRDLSAPPPMPRKTSAASAAKSRSASRSAPAQRAMQLPRTIPVTRSRSSHASSADFDDLIREDQTDFQPLKRRRREEREPAMPAYMTTLLQTRKPSAPAKQAPAAAKPKESFNTTMAPSMPAFTQSGPCPGMFRGLSSISLSEQLFAGAFATRDEDESRTLVHSSSSSSLSGSAVGSKTPVSVPLVRRCSRPLWCLVGTFKTGLSSVVSADPVHDRLYWQQRNPRGGFQSIHVPLSGILDAFVARVTQQDEDIQERQFTVVIRTSTRPSQIVFGFRTVTEANQFMKMVMPAKSVAAHA